MAADPIPNAPSLNPDPSAAKGTVYIVGIDKRLHSLSAGTDTYVLTAKASATNGVDWEAPSSGASPGGFTGNLQLNGGGGTLAGLSGSSYSGTNLTLAGPLTVNTTTNANGLTINTALSTAAQGLAIINNTGETGSLFIGGTASSYPSLVGFYTNSANGFAILTSAGTKVLQIVQAGRTLIGPTLPTDDGTTALQVNGGIKSGGNINTGDGSDTGGGNLSTGGGAIDTHGGSGTFGAGTFDASSQNSPAQPFKVLGSIPNGSFTSSYMATFRNNTNTESLDVAYDSSAGRLRLFTNYFGSGVEAALEIGTYSNPAQLVLNTDGSTTFAGSVTAGAGTFASLAGDGSALTGLPVPTIASVLASGNDADGANLGNVGGLTFNASTGGINLNNGSFGGAGSFGIFGISPIIQQGPTGDVTVINAGTSLPVLYDTTFSGGSGSGYTIGDIIAALKAYGLIAG